MAEAFGVNVLSFRVLEACKDRLELVEHVLGWLVVVMVGILDGEHILPEARVHKQLLEQRDHVADAAEVLHANEASATLLVIKVHNLPVVEFIRPPGSLTREVSHIIEYAL